MAVGKDEQIIDKKLEHVIRESTAENEATQEQDKNDNAMDRLSSWATHFVSRGKLFLGTISTFKILDMYCSYLFYCKFCGVSSFSSLIKISNMYPKPFFKLFYNQFADTF